MKKSITIFLFSLLIIPFCLAAGRTTLQNGGGVEVGTSDNPLQVMNLNTTLAGGGITVPTAGTGLVISSSTPCKRVLIKASLDNTGNIFVGGSDVDKTTENGFPLDAGEVWIGTVDNLADIWIDATVSGDGVSFSYEN